MTTNPNPDTLIRLDAVSKVYPGSETPAVEALTMDIYRGEVLVLVGPSGCGKSTTLRLINRMIEPSSGRIVFDGEDVTDVNPDHLRRQIGYVIQQVGLFPHLTIADNVATVPRLLGWEKRRISERVDELLDLVGMEPQVYRDRYPKELSGGQAQRVGVARALGADPDVLLMDEPFGAIDPITRERLQNEFLRLQSELRKTIVFVTHDIDEAIKMGDRIAILRNRSVIAQHDTPESILAAPANDFVDDFLGDGTTLKSLTLRRIADIELDDYATVRLPTGRREALEALERSDTDWVLLLDEQNRPLRWLNARSIDRSDAPLSESGQVVRVTVEPQDTLRNALEAMLHSTAHAAIVVDRGGAYLGAVFLETLADKLRDSVEQVRRQRREVSV